MYALDYRATARVVLGPEGSHPVALRPCACLLYASRMYPGPPSYRATARVVVGPEGSPGVELYAWAVLAARFGIRRVFGSFFAPCRGVASLFTCSLSTVSAIPSLPAFAPSSCLQCAPAPCRGVIDDTLPSALWPLADAGTAVVRAVSQQCTWCEAPVCTLREDPTPDRHRGKDCARFGGPGTLPYARRARRQVVAASCHVLLAASVEGSAGL